jgi:hypothetical protein
MHSNSGQKNASDSLPRTAPTPAETEINGLLKEKFGGTLVVVNDKSANWPKDIFDYFIVPRRKDYPDYPYIANGDFNGDGLQDAAALVKNPGKEEYQVAIIFGSPLDKHRSYSGKKILTAVQFQLIRKENWKAWKQEK